MNHKVMLKTETKDYWIGTVVEYDDGYRFISLLPSVGNSKKTHDRLENAVPKRIKNWYFA